MFSVLSIRSYLSKKGKRKKRISTERTGAISRNNSKGRFLWFMKKRVPGMRDPATPDKSRPLYDPNNQDPSIQVGAPTRFLRTPPRRRRSTYQSVVDSSPGSKEILSPVITYRELASPHTVRILPPTPEYFYNILPEIISGEIGVGMSNVTFQDWNNSIASRIIRWPCCNVIIEILSLGFR